jgi:hypothetical protein
MILSSATVRLDFRGGRSMPDPQFTVHVDPDVLARQDLAAAVSVPALPNLESDDRSEPGLTEEHHGARDARLAARQQSERERAGRAAGTSGGRSYAFRRS